MKPCAIRMASENIGSSSVEINEAFLALGFVFLLTIAYSLVI